MIADADNKAALDALIELVDIADDAYYQNGEQHEYAETIRAALQGAAMSQKVDEWQPIETAPKDGTDILIYCKDTHEMFVAFYATQIETGQQDWIIARAKDGTCFVLKSPTHWMPLPPQPKGGE